MFRNLKAKSEKLINRVGEIIKTLIMKKIKKFGKALDKNEQMNITGGFFTVTEEQWCKMQCPGECYFNGDNWYCDHRLEL